MTRALALGAALGATAFVAMTVGARALRAQSSVGATHLLVVSGAGGEAAYREAFHAMGARLATAATARLGLRAGDVTFLAEDSTRLPARGRSSRAGVEAAIAGIARRAAAEDRIVIVLIGHGSAQGGVPRFNLPGPDISAAELAAMVAPLGARTVVIVNTASASGDWVPVLSGRHRIVMTATKSGAEGNATMFPRHFVEALAADGADADKDGLVSLLEAYAYARREVARAFAADNRLLTEHAQLDDDGDGKATADPAGRSTGAGAGDGALARRFAFGGTSGGGMPTVASTPVPDSATVVLAVRRTMLQRELETLRARKAVMPTAEYERDLERLLVALATVNRSLRERLGAGPRR